MGRQRVGLAESAMLFCFRMSPWMTGVKSQSFHDITHSWRLTCEYPQSSSFSHLYGVRCYGNKDGGPPLLGSSLSVWTLLKWAFLYNTLRDEEPCACVLQVSKKTRKERPIGWGEEPRTKQVDSLLIILSYPFMEHPTVDKVPMQTPVMSYYTHFTEEETKTLSSSSDLAS